MKEWKGFSQIQMKDEVPLITREEFAPWRLWSYGVTGLTLTGLVALVIAAW